MTINDYAQVILEECSQALGFVDNEECKKLTETITASDKVFFIGVGRVLLSLKAICKRFAHLGIDAHIVGEITEPAITKRDLLIVASGSGESLIPKAIAFKAEELGAKIAWIGSNTESSIAKIADIRVRIPVQTKLDCEDEIKSKQPMTSLFEQSLLILGDSIAMELIHEKKLDLPSLWNYHANLE